MKNLVMMALVGLVGSLMVVSNAQAQSSLDKFIAQQEAAVASDAKNIENVGKLVFLLKNEPKAGMTVALDATLVAMGAGAGIPGSVFVAKTVLDGLTIALEGAKTNAAGNLVGIDDVVATTFKIEGASAKAYKGALKIGGWLAVPCTIVAFGGAVYAGVSEAELSVLTLTIDHLRNDMNYRRNALILLTQQSH